MVSVARYGSGPARKRITSTPISVPRRRLAVASLLRTLGVGVDDTRLSCVTTTLSPSRRRPRHLRPPVRTSDNSAVPSFRCMSAQELAQEGVADIWRGRPWNASPPRRADEARKVAGAESPAKGGEPPEVANSPGRRSRCRPASRAGTSSFSCVSIAKAPRTFAWRTRASRRARYGARGSRAPTRPPPRPPPRPTARELVAEATQSEHAAFGAGWKITPPHSRPAGLPQEMTGSPSPLRRLPAPATSATTRDPWIRRAHHAARILTVATSRAATSTPMVSRRRWPRWASVDPDSRPKPPRCPEERVHDDQAAAAQRIERHAPAQPQVGRLLVGDSRDRPRGGKGKIEPRDHVAGQSSMTERPLTPTSSSGISTHRATVSRRSAGHSRP